MRFATLGWQLALVFMLSLLALAASIVWLQNVHIITTNGMYKSIDVEPWIADPGRAHLDPSNYLYFPLYGRLCALLDVLGISRGHAWKQLAYLNAFWASVGSVLVYAFAFHLFRSALVASAATIFHFGMGFVLLLSVISEDIMPGYVVVLGSMMLAALWFERPTYLRTAVVGMVFTLGWLVEWRLIFPTLPALLLALAVSQCTPWNRLKHIASLIIAIVATAGIVQQLWEGHTGAASLPDLLWTGKGMNTGWGGLTADKPWLLLSGLGGYLLVQTVAATAEAARNGVTALAFAVLLEVAVLVACLTSLWSRRRDRRLWSIACVSLGTFGAGEVFNVYAQPHDPQMQINVMAWLPVAWMLLLGSLLPYRRLVQTAAAFSALPLAFNFLFLSSFRGADARMTEALSLIEDRFPTDSTVFLYWGFEPITTWQYALWSHTWDWESAGPPPPAPSKDPKFKWIAIDSGAIHHPDWSAEQDAETVKRFVVAAFDKGYRVVVSDSWTWSVQELTNQLGTLSASNRAPAIYDALHGSFSAGPAVQVPGVGAYYELKRR